MRAITRLWLKFKSEQKLKREPAIRAKIQFSEHRRVARIGA